MGLLERCLSSRQLLLRGAAAQWRAARTLQPVRALATTSSARDGDAVRLRRTVVECAGKDAFRFLQGLTTQDLEELDDIPMIYTLMLNPKGRVLFDMFLSRGQDDDTFLLECDTNALPQFKRHMLMYKLRNKLTLNERSDLGVYSVRGAADPHDPRRSMQYLGVDRTIGPVDTTTEESWDFTALRFANGIGEGTDDFKLAEGFPFEYNLDIDNGVSMTKGCYLGQELTSRTWHTGVIRKRLMPVQLSSGSELPAKCVLLDDKKKPAAHINSQHGTLALASARLARVKLDHDYPVVDGSGTELGTGRIVFPEWWPEALKDSLGK